MATLKERIGDIPTKKEGTDPVHSVKEQTTKKSTEEEKQVEKLREEELIREDPEQTGLDQGPTDQAPNMSLEQDPTDLVPTIDQEQDPTCLDLGTLIQTLEDLII